MCGAHIIDPSAARHGHAPSPVAVFGGSMVPGDGYVPAAAVGCKWTNEQYLCEGILDGNMDKVVHDPVQSKASEHASISVMSSGDDDEEDTHIPEGMQLLGIWWDNEANK